MLPSISMGQSGCEPVEGSCWVASFTFTGRSRSRDPKGKSWDGFSYTTLVKILRAVFRSLSGVYALWFSLMSKAKALL